MFRFDPLCIGALALVIMLGLPGCGGNPAASSKVDTAADSNKQAPLIVGMELGYPPFEMIDPSGQPTGISVEMAGALAEKLGRELRIENIPFAGLIPALQSGRVDLVISSMTVTPERAKSVDFSDPYVKIGLAMLVQADEESQDIAAFDHPGKSIAVKRGTTGATYAEKNLNQARTMVFDRSDTAVLEVGQGRADAFIYDQLSIDRYARQFPETTRPILEPIRVEEWAVAMRKGNKELHREVNAFLAEFKEQGGFDRLGNKYLKEAKESFAERGVPFVF